LKSIDRASCGGYIRPKRFSRDPAISRSDLIVPILEKPSVAVRHGLRS
jgi:hypothetical protein